MIDASKKKTGGRKRTGTLVKTRTGQWQSIVTLADGSRKRLEPYEKGTSEAYARERTEFWAEQYALADVRKPAVPGIPAPDSAEAWWKNYDEERRKTGLRGILGIWEKHLRPVCEKHPKDVTEKDCEGLVAALDKKVRAGEMSWKTAFNAWAIWATHTKAASGSWKKDKTKQFKVREGDPCAGVAPPDRDDPKELQWLYPIEVVQLLACERVPVEWRLRYALATYLFLRGGELAALRWENFNMDRGVVSIRHSFDQDSGQTKKTKTGNKGKRRFAIEPALMPLLRAMHAAAGGTGLVVSMPARKHWAAKLRDHLPLAGVNRPELFCDPKDATQKRLRFHDCRSTGLTWLAIMGVDQHKIQGRAGHTSFLMTQKYIRAAEEAGTDVGQPFPPVPQALIDHVNRSKGGQVFEIIVEAPGIEPGSARRPVSFRSRA